MSKHIAVTSSLMFLWAGVANAYVVTTTDDAAPVHWAAYPVAYRVNADPTADVGGTAEAAVIDSSFAAWDDVVEETELFTNDGETESGYDDVMCQHKSLSADGTCSDQINTVVWAESEWAEGSGSIGLTYALFLVSTGEVFEADITMNGQHHDWATDGTEEAMDVANILTHEIGGRAQELRLSDAPAKLA